MPKRVLRKPVLPDALLQPIKLDLLLMPSILEEGSIEGAEARFQVQLLERLKFVEDARGKKLDLLTDFYGLSQAEPDYWKSLALRIAYDFIDGFKTIENKPRGRKGIWDDKNHYLLWHDVRRLLETGEYPDQLSSCYALAEQPYWAKLVSKKSSARNVGDNLYEQYLHAKQSPFVRWITNILSDKKISKNYHGDIANDFAEILLSTS